MRSTTTRGPFPSPTPPPNAERPGSARPLSAVPISAKSASFSPTWSLHHVHAAHAAARHAGTGRLLLGGFGDHSLGREDVLRDPSCVLQRGADDHGRVGDAGLDEILVLTALDVESVPLRAVPDLVDDDRALEARVVRELPDRLLERARHDRHARPLVALEPVELDRLDGGEKCDTTAGDDAFLEGGTGRLQCILDAVLLLLHLRLGRSADLDDRNATGELRQPLLQLLAVEVGVGVLDLLLQLLDPGLDRLGVAG